MTVRGKVVLYPGHGLNTKNRYGRPLMTLKNGEPTAVPASMWPHPEDKEPGYYREDFGTLAIAKAARRSLECMGYQVFLTRNDDRSSAQYLRDELVLTPWQKKFWKEWRLVRQYCNTVDSNICVAIHTNAGGGTGITGFYPDTKGKPLAQSIADAIHSKLDLRIRSVRKRKFSSLLSHSGGQTCLIECAFHDNAHDLQILLQPLSIERLGDSIAWGIDNYVAWSFISH